MPFAVLLEEGDHFRVTPRNAPPAPPPPLPSSRTGRSVPPSPMEIAPAAESSDDASGESALSTAKYRPIPTPTAAFSVAELEAATLGAEPVQAAAPTRPSTPPPLPSQRPPPMRRDGGPRDLRSPPAPAPQSPLTSSGAFFGAAPMGSVSSLPSSHFAAHVTSSVPAVGIRTDAPRDIRPARRRTSSARAPTRSSSTRAGTPDRDRLGALRQGVPRRGALARVEDRLPARRRHQDPPEGGQRRGPPSASRWRRSSLERVQGHPNIVAPLRLGRERRPRVHPRRPSATRWRASSSSSSGSEMSLEERLKGSRARGKRDDLLALRRAGAPLPRARLHDPGRVARSSTRTSFATSATATSSRRTSSSASPNPNLRGSTLEVRLADFNVAKLHDADVNFADDAAEAACPGTLFFQSPEQETNVIELLVNVHAGLARGGVLRGLLHPDREERHVRRSSTAASTYPILYADRAKKRIVLDRPYREASEVNVRAKVQKSVGRPADIYSLGALFYYLISGRLREPEDPLRRLPQVHRVRARRRDQHHRGVPRPRVLASSTSLRAPKQPRRGVEVAPADRFFTYKHYLDGNGDLIDAHVMKIIARCMIRNKPDSYCQAHDVETRAASATLVQDLIDLYARLRLPPRPRAPPSSRGGVTRSSGGASSFARSVASARGSRRCSARRSGSSGAVGGSRRPRTPGGLSGPGARADNLLKLLAPRVACGLR